MNTHTSYFNRFAYSSIKGDKYLAYPVHLIQQYSSNIIVDCYISDNKHTNTEHFDEIIRSSIDHP